MKKNIKQINITNNEMHVSRSTSNGMKKFLISIFTIITFFSPVFLIHAEETKWSGLVPVCNTIVDAKNGGFSDPCDFNMVMNLINHGITYLLFVIATPMCALIIAYAGWLYITSSSSEENKGKAKKILTNVVIGYIIALAAWIIVKAIMTGLGYNGTSFLS